MYGFWMSLPDSALGNFFYSHICIGTGIYFLQACLKESGYMDWYSMETKAVGKALETDIEKGLGIAEASRRLEKNGPNAIGGGENKKSLIMRFLAQFNDFMVIVLIAAAGVSAWASWISGENDYADSLIIIGIIAANAAIGVFQESKAEKALEALKKLSSPRARVIREGREMEVAAEDVVTGDVLTLEAGDLVCADARVISSKSLKAEEAAITGESEPVEKHSGRLAEGAALGDRTNMLLATSYITYGRGTAVVCAAGMDTEVGKIAGMMEENSNQDETPLQKRLDKTGRTLGIAALAVCGVIFCMGLLRRREPMDMFMTSVSLAVAAIPEGLPAIVTIVLAIGMQAMSRSNAIIRRLPAVETLGSADVICSDKTGTLTQNKMRVLAVNGAEGRLTENIVKRREILKLFALCTDVKEEEGRVRGEPTETALAEGYIEAGGSLVSLNREYRRIGELPFSSERKLMTAVYKLGRGGYLTVTKGAPDVLLSRCQYYDADGRAQSMTPDIKRRIMADNDKMACAALRVLAAAYSISENRPVNITEAALERGLVFAGLAGLMDTPRPEAAEAVKTCIAAGIRPVMITGDHVLTARAIAGKLGINGLVMTGAELSDTSDEELKHRAEGVGVFARVSPEHKVRIVKALKSNGHVVAMTGDGVNDAPALKAADIGCAMGMNGTEVAKGAADMILTDDNFATIVSAVREGRRIYSNIRKSVHFLISSNIGEIITIFSAMCFGFSLPLLPIQLLWVNLVTDSLPAIALGMEPPEPDAMREKPKPADESLFAGGMGVRILLEGCMIGMLALTAFAIGHKVFDTDGSHIIGRTMAFAVLSISQLVHAFNMKSEKSLFHTGIMSNKALIASFAAGLAMQVGVIMLPALTRVFKVQSLSAVQWLVVALLSLVPVLVVELEKKFAGQ